MSWSRPLTCPTECRIGGSPDREQLCLVGHASGKLRAASELVKQSPHDGPIVKKDRATGARAIEDGLWAVSVAYTQHLQCYLVQRFVPGNALELARSPLSHAAHGVLEPVGMVDILCRSEAPNARVEGRELRIPRAGLSADLDDPPVADVGVDDTSSATTCGRRCWQRRARLEPWPVVGLDRLFLISWLPLDDIPVATCSAAMRAYERVCT